jgi:pyruvate/2-oxoglutarate dehydrogenase complex dihydrolipoamide acyltransferase (E2) component
VSKALFRNPHLAGPDKGTTTLTAAGMSAWGAGWGITMALYALGVTLGSTVERPAWVDGQIEPHEYLRVALSFDHGIVDGAPAACFSQRFEELP